MDSVAQREVSQFGRIKEHNWQVEGGRIGGRMDKIQYDICDK